MQLKAEHITFRYPCGKRAVLEDFDLTLTSGERVGLWGPSGFGKTTLCRILAGYQQPDAGRVLLDGKPLAAYPGYCPVQLVWQHPEWSLDPRMKMSRILAQAGPLPPELLSGTGDLPRMAGPVPLGAIRRGTATVLPGPGSGAGRPFPAGG